MLRSLLLGICMLATSFCFAQNEKFKVIYRNNNLVLEHKIRKGENVFSVARRYHVPPSLLSDVNNLSYQSELPEGNTLDIPIAVYNHINEEPGYMNDVRPLYYTVDGRESMSRVVKITGVPLRKIEKWNNLADNNLHDGQELMVGWVLYDATPITQAVKEPENVAKTRGDWSTRAIEEKNEKAPKYTYVPERTLDNLQPDTVKTIAKCDTVLSADGELYMSQTLHEQRVITEKGPAVFFTSANKSPKSFYAFHNSARRGAIIKVFNPGTGKVVYVKVIGTIPATAQYYNSIIGISAAAKKELGVRENKMFCELTYGVL